MNRCCNAFPKRTTAIKARKDYYKVSWGEIKTLNESYTYLQDDDGDFCVHTILENIYSLIEMHVIIILKTCVHVNRGNDKVLNVSCIYVFTKRAFKNSPFFQQRGRRTIIITVVMMTIRIKYNARNAT